MPEPPRPNDPTQLAKLVLDVATGERENDGGPQHQKRLGSGSLTHYPISR